MRIGGPLELDRRIDPLLNLLEILVSEMEAGAEDWIIEMQLQGIQALNEEGDRALAPAAIEHFELGRAVRPREHSEAHAAVEANDLAPHSVDAKLTQPLARGEHLHGLDQDGAAHERREQLRRIRRRLVRLEIANNVHRKHEKEPSNIVRRGAPCTHPAL